MEAIVMSGIGDKLNLVGFFFTVVGCLAALVGAILMYLGSSLAGESIWENLKKIQAVAENSSVVAQENWTERVTYDLSQAVPPNAKSVTFTYGMRSPDTRIPLKMTVFTSIHFITANVSGEQGSFELNLTDRIIHVSVAHPEINWDLGVTRYEF
ncbi:hypothetical protein [Pseudomonas sp. B10]|uniref:hypothetical protein n=1 Tax=Pseudomonas sp. B10 TaxID=118613 RepID=UPI000970C4FA|nr:hypothetical protein [Pseudomonas sp. B10]